MTWPVTCAECGMKFDLDEADAGRAYLRFPARIPLCSDCIDRIVNDHLEKEGRE